MRTFLVVLLISVFFVVPAFSNDKEKAVDENAPACLNDKEKAVDENAPACLKGFAGMLYGKLIKKLDNGFIFEVIEVTKVWEHNKSDSHKESAGKQIRVYYRKIKTEKGKMINDEMLVAYIRKVEIGKKFSIDVKEDDNRIFFLELTEEQRKYVKNEGKEEEKTDKKPEEMKPELPDGMLGFSGMLKGKVVSKQKNGFVLDVEKIEKLWEGNKAKNAESVIGKKVLINIQWEQHEKGKWRPVPLQAKYIEKLKVGAVITIEVKNDERERLHILELSKEQREWAEKKEEKKDEPKDKKEEKDWKKEFEIPEGMTGFSGILEGVVVKKVDRGFVLKVSGVPQVWDDSKAKNTASVIGKKVLIFVGWVKNDAGKWHPNEKHVKFVNELKLEQKLKIEAKNFEGRHLGILELGD